MTTFVIGWDGNIDELSWGVGIAESDNGDVDIRGFLDGLGIGAGIGNDDEARLLERSSNVVGEVTGGEATSNGHSASVSSKLEDGTLSVGAGRDHTNVGWVVDSCDNPCGKHNLLPAKNKILEFLVS